MERAGWTPQPAADRAAVGRTGSAKDADMLGEPAAVRRALGDGNPGAHGDGHPSELASDLRGEPPVAINGADQPLHVDDLGLQLDDEQ